MYIYMSTPTPSYLEGEEFGCHDVVATRRGRGWPNRRGPYTALEVTQGQISSQSSTDAASSRWHLYGS